MVAPDLTLDPSLGPFGVAVSGGADSLALLLSMHANGFEPIAVTVDHGLRSGSAAEADAVGTLCAARDIPHETIRLSLEDDSGLQARARQERYRALAEWAQRHGLGAVTLGHTADDVAETFLMRLADGAGLDGLAGMAPRFERHGITFLRPLLHVQKAALQDWLTKIGVAWAEDPSNQDDRFERARARKLLGDLDIDTRQIVASAQALRFVSDSVQGQTRRLLDTFVMEDRGDIFIRQATLAELLADDPEQARRVVLAMMRAINRSTYPPRRAEQLELMRRLRDGDAATLAGCLFSSDKDNLRIAREPAAATAASPVQVGQVWDNRWCLDGPGGEVRALGDAVAQTPWRDTGLPRRSLMASPAVWQGERLLAAPLAGVSNGWTVSICDAMDRFREITLNPPPQSLS